MTLLGGGGGADNAQGVSVWRTGTQYNATEQEAKAQGGADSAQCKGSAREAVLNPHPPPYILLYRA